MFVIMGTTRGDELIRSTSKPLATAADKAAAEAECDQLTKTRDTWLASHTLPWWAQAGIYNSFEIVKV